MAASGREELMPQSIPDQDVGPDRDWQLKILICWLNTQGFPSAMVASDVHDLQNGAVMSELCDVMFHGKDPAALRLRPCDSNSPSQRLKRVLNDIEAHNKGIEIPASMTSKTERSDSVWRDDEIVWLLECLRFLQGAGPSPHSMTLQEPGNRDEGNRPAPASSCNAPPPSDPSTRPLTGNRRLRPAPVEPLAQANGSTDRAVAFAGADERETASHMPATVSPSTVSPSLKSLSPASRLGFPWSRTSSDSNLIKYGKELELGQESNKHPEAWPALRMRQDPTQHVAPVGGADHQMHWDAWRVKDTVVQDYCEQTAVRTESPGEKREDRVRDKESAGAGEGDREGGRDAALGQRAGILVNANKGAGNANTRLMGAMWAALEKRGEEDRQDELLNCSQSLSPKHPAGAPYSHIYGAERDAGIESLRSSFASAEEPPPSVRSVTFDEIMLARHAEARRASVESPAQNSLLSTARDSSGSSPASSTARQSPRRLMPNERRAPRDDFEDGVAASTQASRHAGLLMESEKVMLAALAARQQQGQALLRRQMVSELMHDKLRAMTHAPAVPRASSPPTTDSCYGLKLESRGVAEAEEAERVSMEKQVNKSSLEWPFGNRMEQRIRQRGSSNREAVFARVRSSEDQRPTRPETRPESRPPWRPTATPKVVAEERQQQTAKMLGVTAADVRALRDRLSAPAERTEGARERRREAEPDRGREGENGRPSQQEAVESALPRQAHERGLGVKCQRWEPASSAYAEVRPEPQGLGQRDGMEERKDAFVGGAVGLEDEVPLNHMLDSIAYVYGVDLLPDAQGHDGDRIDTKCVSLERLCVALQDGVLLCKLATSMDRVTQTRTRTTPTSPMSSSIRGWTLHPKNRSQRLNNIRIALKAFRNDHSVRVNGHSSHWCLFKPDSIEFGDPGLVQSLMCILYGALLCKHPMSPDKAGHSSRRKMTRDQAQKDNRASGNAVAISWGESGAEERGRDNEIDPKNRSDRARPSSLPPYRGDHVQRQRHARSASPPVATQGRPRRSADASQTAVAVDIPKGHDENGDPAVVLQGEVARNLAAESGLEKCAPGCGGWLEVEQLLAAEKPHHAYDGPWGETLAGTGISRFQSLDSDLRELMQRGRPSIQLQLHTCRWLVTLNLPDNISALSGYEFANLSKASHKVDSLLDDPLKNGCVLLHVAQVLRGQQACAPPWCDSSGRPKTVSAIRKNVTTALQLVRPLFQTNAGAQASGIVEDRDIEALVAGDDVQVWTLLNRLRLVSRRIGSGGIPESRADSKRRKERSSRLLPYSDEQVELLEAAIVIWLSSIAPHVPSLKAVLPSSEHELRGYTEACLVGASPRLLGLVLAAMHDSGGVLLADVASFATEIPIRIMRSVKSHGVAEANMRRICEQLGDMNHVGRRFLPWVHNIVQGDRQATVLLLEELMRCSHGVAPGRRLTAEGHYARPRTSLFQSHGKKQAREIPFLMPLVNSRLASATRQADGSLLQKDGEGAPSTTEDDLQEHRRRLYERHQVWRASISGAVRGLPTGQVGDFRHLEDLEEYVSQKRCKKVSKPVSQTGTALASSIASPSRTAGLATAPSSLVEAETKANTLTKAASNSPNASKPCLRCIAWNIQSRDQTPPALLGARKSSSEARSKSPFKIANSDSRAHVSFDVDTAQQVDGLRNWMRGLKGGLVPWPNIIMECAPQDFASAWSDGVALCLLAGSLQPLAGRTLLQGWERRPRTRAHRAHNVKRALSVLALQAKMHVTQVPVELKSLNAANAANSSAANSIQATNGAVMGTLRGAEALLCEDAIVDGNPDIVLALLRIVQMAYRSPAL